MAKTAVARTVSPLIGLLAALALVAAALLAGMLSSAGADQAASIWNKKPPHAGQLDLELAPGQRRSGTRRSAARLDGRLHLELTLGHPGHPTGPGALNRSRSAPGCPTIVTWRPGREQRLTA